MKKKKNLVEWFCFLFAAVMKWCFPELCIKKWALKENKYGEFFLPDEEKQLEIIKKLSPDEVKARRWSWRIKLIFLTEMQSLPLDEIKEFLGEDAPELLILERLMIFKSLLYLPQCLKLILPLMDEGFLIKEMRYFDYYKWWLDRAWECIVEECLLVGEDRAKEINTQLQDFLLKNKECVNQLKTNPRWAELREALLMHPAGVDNLVNMLVLSPTKEDFGLIKKLDKAYVEGLLNVNQETMYVLYLTSAEDVVGVKGGLSQAEAEQDALIRERYAFISAR